MSATPNNALYVRAATELVELAIARDQHPPGSTQIRLLEGKVWVAFADIDNEVHTAIPQAIREEPEGY